MFITLSLLVIVVKQDDFYGKEWMSYATVLRLMRMVIMMMIMMMIAMMS